MELSEMNGDKVKITVAGNEIEVNKTDRVKETLKKILQEKGINSFTILVNGEEITSTENLPETFGEHKIEVERYVKPGIR